MSEVFRAELNRLGSMFRDPVTVRFDFSRVEALQGARTERLDRVSKHISHGMTAADAYRMEGFDEAAELVSNTLQPEQDTEVKAVIDLLEKGGVTDTLAMEMAEVLRPDWRSNG